MTDPICLVGKMSDSVFNAFVFGVGLGSLVTYLNVTHKPRTVARIKRMMQYLADYHNFSRDQTDQLLWGREYHALSVARYWNVYSKYHNADEDYWTTYCYAVREVCRIRFNLREGLPTQTQLIASAVADRFGFFRTQSWYRFPHSPTVLTAEFILCEQVLRLKRTL
jgi:hypothetical protein